MKTKNNQQLINIITLGCSKNLVDSEFLMKQIHANGLQVVHNDNTQDAHAVIINTCGFITDAKEESIDTILQFAREKEKGNIGHLYVMGCLSERYKSDLESEIPDVDKYFGTNNIKDIIKTLGYNYKDNLTGERMLTTPNHYAYLKISEGCDRQCSFCTIPLMRGKHQSKSVESILSEAKLLIDQGVKELILIAQDLTYYGVDMYYKQTLAELLLQLSELENLHWIRLHYAYPAGFPTDVLRVMREKKNICNYLDIPFQHISDTVLKKMRRGITSKQTYSLINQLRESIPKLTLRTTLMVGHPGEGTDEFDELLHFAEQCRFDRLGVFTYCEEEGTFGARNFDDRLTEEEKQVRADRLMALQNEISFELNSRKTGQEVTVIIDRREGEYWIGRTEGDSPEVDNEVLITSEEKLTIGEFYRIKITRAEHHDLEGIYKKLPETFSGSCPFITH
jgi:ribosomal protein S12 methylthiotransferase